MNTKLVRILPLVAAVALAACGESTDLVMGELTEAEAQDLASALMFATFNSTGDVPEPPAAGPQAVPFEFSQEVSGEVACPLGGVVRYEASVDITGDTESEAGRIEYSMTQAHDGCGVAAESGKEFTLDGAPNITLDFVVVNTGEGVVEWGGGVEGVIHWVSEGFEGTCVAAFEFNGRQEGEASITGGLGGTICGHEISRAFSIG